jgi:hypothetical protein
VAHVSLVARLKQRCEVPETTVDFNAQVKQWDRFINVAGGYVEKEMFFQV